MHKRRVSQTTGMHRVLEFLYVTFGNGRAKVGRRDAMWIARRPAAISQVAGPPARPRPSPGTRPRPGSNFNLRAEKTNEAERAEGTYNAP